MIHRVARIARLGVLARQRLAHNHPQRVGNRRVVAARQHKPVRVRVLGPAVVVAQPAQLAARQVRCDRVRRVRQGPPEVAGLRVVPQQNQRHRGEKADVLKPRLVIFGQLDLGGRAVG